MKQNTPKFGLALRWPILAALHIEWGKEAVPEYQPSTKGGTGHKGLAAAKDGDERSCLLGYRLTSEESAWHKL